MRSSKLILHFCICFGIALLASHPQASTATKRLYAEDSIANLTGRLEIQAFPGPPNYESIAQGDEHERGLFIRLDRPITVSSSEGEIKINILHLAGALAERDFESGKKGSKTRVSGRVFLRFNGHHHTRVLLEVTSIETREEAL